MQKYTNDTCEVYKNQITQSGVEQGIQIIFIDILLELYKNTEIQQVTNFATEHCRKCTLTFSAILKKYTIFGEFHKRNTIHQETVKEKYINNKISKPQTQFIKEKHVMHSIRFVPLYKF